MRLKPQQQQDTLSLIESQTGAARRWCLHPHAESLHYSTADKTDTQAVLGGVWVGVRLVCPFGKGLVLRRFSRGCLGRAGCGSFGREFFFRGCSPCSFVLLLLSLLGLLPVALVLPLGGCPLLLLRFVPCFLLRRCSFLPSVGAPFFSCPFGLVGGSVRCLRSARSVLVLAAVASSRSVRGCSVGCLRGLPLPLPASLGCRFVGRCRFGRRSARSGRAVSLLLRAVPFLPSLSLRPCGRGSGSLLRLRAVELPINLQHKTKGISTMNRYSKIAHYAIFTENRKADAILAIYEALSALREADFTKADNIVERLEEALDFIEPQDLGLTDWN